jgi:hypothetical protein
VPIFVPLPSGSTVVLTAGDAASAAEAADDGVLKFAAKWGVIAFCEHGLPYRHCQTNDCFCRPVEPFLGKSECEPMRIGNRWADPLVYWRRLSAIAAAILNIAADVNLGRPGKESDWRLADIEYMHGLEPSGTMYRTMGGRSTSVARRSLSSLITDWLRIGDIFPIFRWGRDRGQWEMVLGCPHEALFGYIGLSLMMAVSEKGGLAICSCCHNSYIPSRRPNPERRNYCPTCGKRAAWRDAARERRARR